MAWKAKQTRRFARVYIKLSRQTALDVNEAVDVICLNPLVRTRKKGDLSDLLVYKFHSNNHLYLLGCTMEEEPRLVYLEAVGPHENFYQNLKCNSLYEKMIKNIK